jgi:hypothetical protein
MPPSKFQQDVLTLSQTLNECKALVGGPLASELRVTSHVGASVDAYVLYGKGNAAAVSRVQTEIHSRQATGPPLPVA